jgi:multimeric flavodoxin WrbA
MARRKPKQVLVLLGSPRKRGNSAILASKIAAGAKAGGAEVESFYLHGMDIRPCTACDACKADTKKDCVLQDDMQLLYPKLRAADAIVIASPIYWFHISSQTKLCMDRWYALGDTEDYALKGKRIAIALTYADPDPVSSGAINAIRTFQDAFRYVGAEIVGMVYGTAWEAGAIKANRALLKEARALGKALVT